MCEGGRQRDKEEGGRVEGGNVCGRDMEGVFQEVYTLTFCTAQGKEDHNQSAPADNISDYYK